MKKTGTKAELARDAVLHIATLNRMALADGRFLPEEGVAIKVAAAKFAYALGFDSFEEVAAMAGDLTPEDGNAWKSSLAADASKAKRLVGDMLFLAYADGEKSAEEDDLVVATAKELGLADGVLAELADAVSSVVRAEEKLEKTING